MDKDTKKAIDPVRLNPKFDDLESLDNPETIIGHVRDKIDQAEKDRTEKSFSFPVDVFPESVREIIETTNTCLLFPIDFTAAAVLFAASVAIGNTHRAEHLKGWQENAVIYLALVGPPGTNKSHPVTWALKPIEQQDKKGYEKYKAEKEQYDYVSKLTPKERDAQGYDEPENPKWEQYLVTDFTPESLAEVHKHNVRGIGVYVDELATWFKNFNRYSKGSDEQFWLSNWSGKPIRINRKTTEPTYIPLPFIPVIGTIQPGVVKEMAVNRRENGFMDRILFAAPDSLKKDYWSESELDPQIPKNWEVIILKLIGMELPRDEEGNLKPTVLKFTPDAKKILFEWQREMTDQYNDLDDDSLKGIYAKIEMYVIRFSLILELLQYACSESDKQAIGIKSVQGAIKLVKYFKKTAFKVNSIIDNTDPLEQLTETQRSLYESLPDTFTKKEGEFIAGSIDVSERTFKRFVGKKDLFQRVEHGKYRKLL